MDSRSGKFLAALQSLSMRDRVLAIFAFCAVVLAAINLLWVGPLQSEARALRERLKQQQVDSVTLAAAAQVVAAKPKLQPLDAG